MVVHKFKYARKMQNFNKYFGSIPGRIIKMNTCNTIISKTLYYELKALLTF